VSGVLITVWLCAATAALVFVAMIVSIVTFGKSLRGHPPASVSGKTAEVLWALIPIAIVLAAATPALRTIVSPALPQAAIWGGEHVIAGYALNKK
jgi:heme/copper-type cytochrome/quinol oxidase subunit 2